jgi:hypothetical protein
LSNVAVANADGSWLETARPTCSGPEIENPSLPTTVHVTPSLEMYAVICEPRRESLTHRGAVPVPPDVLTVVPPETVRR